MCKDTVVAIPANSTGHGLATLVGHLRVIRIWVASPTPFKARYYIPDFAGERRTVVRSVDQRGTSSELSPSRVLKGWHEDPRARCLENPWSRRHVEGR